MLSMLEKVICWQLNRCTLSITPILARRTPRGVAGPLGKQDVLIRFQNDIEWSTGKLLRAVTTGDATKANNLFTSEIEARAERDLILASIEAQPILFFESKSEKEECQNTSSEQPNSSSSTTKLKRKTKKKQSTEQKPQSKWDLGWAADGLSETPNSLDTLTPLDGKSVKQKDNLQSPST